ncbi:MAG: ISL3 family transposase, partial [Gammaproteobacteria bacterium]
MQADAIQLSLGIDGFRVIASDEREDVIEVAIETTSPAACCPGCGHADATPKERKLLWVRDLPLRPGKQTWLIWNKRRFACHRCRRTFTETCADIPPRATHTCRFDAYLSARAVEIPYAQVGDEEGVTFYRIDKASRARAQRALADREVKPPSRLCIDEQSHLRGQVYNTVISDPDHPRVLELVKTRKRKPLQDFLASLPDATKAAIREVCIDMHRPYRDAIRSALPDAAIVCDRFHVERMVLDAVDALRRSIQSQLAKGAKAPLFRARRKLRKGRRKLTLKDLDDLAALFDDHPDLEVAWSLAWDMKRVYAGADRAEATRRLHQFYEGAEESGLVVFAELVQTLRAWETEILNHFDSRLTNGYAEGVTNKIKVIKRRAYG